MYLSIVMATVKNTLPDKLTWEKQSNIEYRVKKVVPVQPRATGTRKRLLVRKAISARQRHDRREGNIAFAFLIFVVSMRVT